MPGLFVPPHGRAPAERGRIERGVHFARAGLDQGVDRERLAEAGVHLLKRPAGVPDPGLVVEIDEQPGEMVLVVRRIGVDVQVFVVDGVQPPDDLPPGEPVAFEQRLVDGQHLPVDGHDLLFQPSRQALGDRRVGQPAVQQGVARDVLRPRR